MNSLNPNEPNPVCTVTSSCDGIVAAEGVALASLCAAAAVLAVGNARCWCAGRLARWALYLASALGGGILINWMVVLYTCGFTMAPGTESVAVLSDGYFNFAVASAGCLLLGLAVPGESRAQNARRVRTAYFGLMLVLLMLVVS